MIEQRIDKAKSKRRKIFIIISVAVAVFSVPLIVNIPNFRGMFEARAVSKAFNKALVAKDYTMAYNLLAPETKANVSYDKFAGIEDMLGDRAGALRSFGTSEMDTKGDKDNLVTTIHANLKFERETLQFEYVLKEEHGI